MTQTNELEKIKEDLTNEENEAAKSQDQKTDEEYLFSRVQAFIKGAEKISESELTARIDEIRFLQLVLHFKYNYQNTYIDSPLEECSQEKIENILIGKGLFVSYNEEIKQWQCPLSLRKGILITVDNTKALAVLRAALFKVSGGVYDNYPDVGPSLVNLWAKINKADKKDIQQSILAEACKNVGLDLNALEKEIEEKAKENQNG